MNNTADTTKAEILAQMHEKRPLPMGRNDFYDWSDRIISGALVPGDIRSQRFALASQLMHLGPQESHKEDAYFIHSLRRSVVQQVAHAMMTQIKDEAQAELAAQEADAELAKAKADEDRMEAAVEQAERTVIKYDNSEEGDTEPV